MAIFSEFRTLFDEWIAAVTGAVDGVAGHLVSARRILLDEGEDGGFRKKSGSVGMGWFSSLACSR